jgi:D-glycero-beta-D-manno-heptose-7-phosphate kinase
MSDFPEKIRTEFPERKVVIVGDLVADQFLHGNITRVSREAPVFILRHDETETFAGGAANAAVNVAALGGKAVVVGVVGQDENGKRLLQALEESKVDCSHIVKSEAIPTTAKVRVLAGQRHTQRQQVVRIDYEHSTTLDQETNNQLKENLVAAVKNADVVIISDYNYGVANAEIAELTTTIYRKKNIPVVVDSRFRLKNFPDVTSATPNQEETEELLGEDFSEADCQKLCADLGYESLLVTCGNKGMLLVEKDKKPLRIEAVGSTEPIDVTGAGDTVIAVYALGLASGLSFAESAYLANHAGGIVVMKKGTASASAEELIESLSKTKTPTFKT